MGLYDIDYVVKNKFSRPGYKLLDVLGIVLHWTANPGGTDENHADFFDGADGGGSRYAGAHMFVDKDSATLIIPLDEVAYQANEKACRIARLKGSIKRADGSTYHGDANVTTISLELCVEKDGTIHPDTIARAVKIVAEWCKKYKLDVNDIYRHYDVTGKLCPRPFVDNPAMFTNFKNNVQNILTPPVVKPKPKPPTAGTYKVESGDTLWGISQRFGVSVANLQSWNGGDLDPLPVGKVLKVAKPAAPKKKYTSLVDFLRAHSMPHDYASRKRLAAKYNIRNYTGTARQNLDLLELLQK